MRGADRIAVASCGDDPFEQAVEITPMCSDRIFIKQADGSEKTVAIECGDLVSRKRRRIFNSQCVKAQIPIDLIEFRVVGDDFELWCLSHRSLPTVSIRRFFTFASSMEAGAGAWIGKIPS